MLLFFFKQKTAYEITCGDWSSDVCSSDLPPPPPPPPPPNQPPTAAFTSSCSNLSCSFTSTSSDPDGSIGSYSWHFGEGVTATMQDPSRAYTAAGTFTVTLTVTDNLGAQSAPASHSVTVTVPNQPPTANFTSSCSGLSCSSEERRG